MAPTMYLHGYYFYLCHHTGIGWPRSLLSCILFERFIASWDKKLNSKTLFTILSHTFVKGGLVGRYVKTGSQFPLHITILFVAHLSTQRKAFHKPFTGDDI